MRKFANWIITLLLIASVGTRVFAADPVDQTRLISGGSWEGKVGIVGGIPAVTTVFTTLNPGATAAQINSAVSSCPSNQVVFLSAGTYTPGGNIHVDKDGVVLRGATNSLGVPTTIIKNTTIDLGDFQGWDFGSSSQWTTTTVSSGATRGSTTMAFASVSGLVVGRLVWLHASSSATVTGGNWSDVFTIYPVSQVMRVASISGNNVTFELPFNADYWSGTIRAAWKGFQKTRAAIEDISLTPTDASAGYAGNYIEVRGANECWIKNVKTYDIQAQNTHHIWVYGSYRLEIRHCDSSRMRAAEGGGDASNNYCVLLAHSGSWLIEDNYYHSVPNVMPVFDSGGGAFAYNYINDLTYGNGSPGWLSQIVFNHGSHMHYNLYEGNWCAGSYNEAGTSGSRNTIWFRNRMLGWDPNPTQSQPKTDDTVSIVVAVGHNNMVLAGNVMGKDGYHTSYQTVDSNAGGSYGNNDSFPNHTVIHVETTALTSLSKIANYNTVDDAIPAGEAIGGGNALVTSYLHSTKPAWFGDRPWPWCDSSNYTQSNTATNIPAAFRAVFGFDVGSSGGGGGGGGGGGTGTPIPKSIKGKVTFKGKVTL
jgi:hypothetical protein